MYTTFHVGISTYKSKLKWRLNLDLDLAGGGIWIWRELGEMEFGANWGKWSLARTGGNENGGKAKFKIWREKFGV